MSVTNKNLCVLAALREIKGGVSHMRKLPIPTSIHQVGQEILIGWQLKKEVPVSVEMAQKIDDFIQRYAFSEKKSLIFTSFSDALQRLADYGNLEPSTLIFQSSRCGSTLLYRLFKTDPEIFAFNESPFVSQINHTIGSQKITDPQATQHYLIPAFHLHGMFYPESTQKLVFKLTSHALFFWSSFQEHLPKTLKYFLYRDPKEIIASLNLEPPPYLRNKTSFAIPRCLPKEVLIEKAELRQIASYLVGAYFEQALKAQSEKCFNRLIHYEQLPKIYRDLNSSCQAQEAYEKAKKEGLLKQHSKRRNQSFKPDSEEKQKHMLPHENKPEIQQAMKLYEKLEILRKSNLTQQPSPRLRPSRSR